MRRQIFLRLFGVDLKQVCMFLIEEKDGAFTVNADAAGRPGFVERSFVYHTHPPAV